MRNFEIVENKFLNYDGAKPILPKRATMHSVCYDFYCPADVVLPAQKITLVWTNIKAIFNENEALILATRSSFASKGIMLANGIGIIESDYANNQTNGGNLGFLLFNSTSQDFKISKNDKFGQGMFITFLTTTDEQPITTKRTGGFGSTN